MPDIPQIPPENSDRAESSSSISLGNVQQAKRYNLIKHFLATYVVLLLILSTAQVPTSQATPVLSVTGSGTNTTPGGDTTYRLELLNHTDQIMYDGVLSANLPIFTPQLQVNKSSGHLYLLDTESALLLVYQ